MVLAPQTGMTSRSLETSRSSNNTSLWIGCCNCLRFPSWIRVSWTLWTKPSLLGKTLVTWVTGHWFLGKASSRSRTMSPSLLSLWGTFHFCRLWRSESYSRRHLIQNWLAKYCTWRHLFLEYKSNCSKLPGGGRTTWDFSVRRWFGVMGSGEAGSDRLSTVSGRLLMTFSASVIKVHNASSSKLGTLFLQ